MSISGLFGKTNISRLDFAIDMPREIYASAPVPVKITLNNKKRYLPAFLVRLKTDRFHALFPFTDAACASSLHTSISFPKRGLYTIQNPHISSVFPFNFFTRFKDMGRTFSCVVFPSLKPCELYSICPEETKGRGEKLSDVLGYESDIVSIREYVRGDPFKYIHWKATAKTGKLKTKELSSLSYRPVIIDFDKVTIRNIEEKLSSLAYTIVQLSKKNIPVGLKINGKFYPPDVSPNHRFNLLSELALYGTNTRTDSMNALPSDAVRNHTSG